MDYYIQDGLTMKDKILEEALKWYEQQEGKPELEDFVDLVISRTADSIFDELRNHLQDEFTNGNLKHSFIISSEYYLDLKLKEIKDKYVKKANIQNVSEDEF